MSSNSNSVARKFKFNGKEYEKALGLGLYEYGARMYDPELGRFTSIDPLTEDYISQSVYVYAANNPVFFQEKNGESPDTIYVNEQGEQIADIDDGSDAVYVVEDGNEEALIKDLIAENVTNDNQNAETNAEIGEKHGFNLEDLAENTDHNYPNSAMHNMGFKVAYEKTHSGKGASFDLVTVNSDSEYGLGASYGSQAGKSDRKSGKMNMFNPKIKSGKPKYNFGSMISSAREARANVAASSKSNTYTIQGGDTLTGIAKSNNTTVGSLVKLNNIKTPNHIEAGAVIKINE